MRRALLSLMLAAAPLATNSPAAAQDALAGKPTGNHAVEVLSDGSFRVTPKGDEAAPEAAAVPDGVKEWFAIKDDRGALKAMIAVTPGATLPGAVLAAMDNGYTIQKTSAPTLIGGLMPSADDIRSALEGMLANARDAICSMGTNRPATFGSNVSIQAGLGVSGTIEFTAEWETASLCIDG